MRISKRNVSAPLTKQITSVLTNLIMDLDKEHDAQTFLKDFFTESELTTISKRLAIAYWLAKGRSYENIKENLKVSSATIASVQAMMDSPGFALAIKKIEAEEWASKWTERIKKFIKR